MSRVTSLRSLVVAAVALCLVACHPGGGEDRAAAAKLLEEALSPREVRLVEPAMRDEQPTLQLVGEVRAFDNVDISPEVVGQIDRVLVEAGAKVSKGDPLVEVDRETFRLRLVQAEANLEAARAELALAAKELERKRDLRADETIPQALLDQALATHDLASARVNAAVATRDLAKRDYDRSVVTAPADGTITHRDAVAGGWADINIPLFRLAVGSAVKVAARVPEAWAPNLSGLDGFEFTVGPSGKVHQARLYRIDPVVQQASRSFEVVGVMRTSDSAVRPGMFANVTLRSPTTQRSMWVPATAVATADIPKVMTVDDGKVVLHAVQTGRRDGADLEIISGLNEGDRIVREVAGLARGLPATVVE